MTGEAFKRWLNEMFTRKLARSDIDCARLLDMTPQAICAMKKRGCDHRTALACRVLVHGMKPYA